MSDISYVVRVRVICLNIPYVQSSALRSFLSSSHPGHSGHFGHFGHSGHAGHSGHLGHRQHRGYRSASQTKICVPKTNLHDIIFTRPANPSSTMFWACSSASFRIIGSQVSLGTSLNLDHDHDHIRLGHQISLCKISYHGTHGCDNMITI